MEAQRAKNKDERPVDKLDDAEEIIARIVHQEAFSQNYEDLIKKRKLSSKSKL